jgi:hypothetical protein
MGDVLMPKTGFITCCTKEIPDKKNRGAFIWLNIKIPWMSLNYWKKQIAGNVINPLAWLLLQLYSKAGSL